MALVHTFNLPQTLIANFSYCVLSAAFYQSNFKLKNENKMYRKLKRVWSHGYANYIPNFDKVFPELKHLNSEELCERFKKLGLEFFQEKQTPIKPLIRVTMPFAIALMLLMFIGIPFVFLITGKWTYPLGEKNRILNWFRSLRLI